MRYLWALFGLVFGLLSIYAGYYYFTSGMTERLMQKGLLLQAPAVLSGIGLVILALPLIYQSVRLATSRPPQ
jgi:hypothetical protein